MNIEEQRKYILMGEELYKKYDKRNTHLAQPLALIDIELTKSIRDEMIELDSKLEFVSLPKTKEDIYINELKRFCQGISQILTDELSPEISTPEQIMARHNVTTTHIEFMKNWLLENRQKIIKANKDQYELYSEHPWSPTYIGSSQVRAQAEKLVDDHIALMKDIIKDLGKVFPLLDTLADEYIITSDSVATRASSNSVGKICNICTGPSTAMYNGKVYLLLEHFLSTFVHEAVGHCYNYLLTGKSDLPLYIRENNGRITSASREGLAMYMEGEFMKVLASSSSFTSLLSKTEPFELMYKRYVDTQVLDTYRTYLHRLAIWVLATTTSEEFEKQRALISQYSIEPTYASHFIGVHRNDWNKQTKLLMPKLVRELRYCVNLFATNNWEDTEIAKNNRELYYKTILTGFWTPMGFIEWVNYNLSIESSNQSAYNSGNFPIRL